MIIIVIIILIILVVVVNMTFSYLRHRLVGGGRELASEEVCEVCLSFLLYNNT